GSFAVAGKSGTTRAWSDGSYEEGSYFSSFAGFFPAEDPQMVILVKLDRPEGAYYGGATAAPVIRATMTDILASPGQPLDWTALAEHQIPAVTPQVPESPIKLAATITDPISPSQNSIRPQFDLSLASDNQRIMPDVRGLPSRSAVGIIHDLGLRIQWSGTGPISDTHPLPGSIVLVGDTVNLVSGRSDGDG
ncbi:uncharacterized protein METZ01_LOCUS365945, partial [marine metagenome]